MKEVQGYEEGESNKIISFGISTYFNRMWYVNPVEGYLVTHKGLTYQVAEEFTECVWEFADTGKIEHLEIGEVEAYE